MRILYKLTTRSRPELAKRAIQSVIDNSVSDDFRIWVTLDEDDKSNYTILNGIAKTYVFTKKETNSKISSINRDLDFISDMRWEILVNLSDDQVFVKKGFDEDIRNAFADNLDQFIHFPDGNQKDLATMSIIGRTYFDRDNYIYHPDYISVYADNEAQDVAKLRGCYKFVDLEIYHHLHPAWGKAQNDEQYLKTEHHTVYNQDHKTYERRKANNFNL